MKPLSCREMALVKSHMQCEEEPLASRKKPLEEKVLRRVAHFHRVCLLILAQKSLNLPSQDAGFS